MQIQTEEFFIPTGSLLRVIKASVACQARNQMWQPNKKRRNFFVEKAKYWINRKVKKITGWDNYRVEMTGSKNLYDVADKKNQAFKIYRAQK